MMRNKSGRTLLLFLLLILFCTSCVNTPDQVLKKMHLTEIPETVNENSKQDENIPTMDAAVASGEVTVTPIILPIIKTGEEAALIIRSVTVEDIQTVSISTPTPDAVTSGSSGSYDAMQAVGFSPINGAVVLPNESLHLDVTLKNTGTTTWQTSYSIEDISTAPITGQNVYNFPYAAAPSGTTIVSMYMKAPAQLGTYTYTFSVRDASGISFGQFTYNLVVGAFSSITSIPTLVPSATPTYYSAEGITATPDSLAWMCIEPERSKLQDCYSFCVEYSDQFPYCFYNGIQYVPISYESVSQTNVDEDEYVDEYVDEYDEEYDEEITE